MQHIFTTRLGKGFLKWLIFLIVFAIPFSGCSAGRGDWQINIVDNYYITHISSNNICLTYKKSADQVGTSFVIDENYFVRSFCHNNDYIGTEGVITKNWYATDDEIESSDVSYYLVNISTGSVLGPYSTIEKFNRVYNTYSTAPLGQWYYTRAQGAKTGDGLREP